MPILQVEIVEPLSDEVRHGLARRLAEAAGDALDARPGGTWVRLRYLAAADYAENAGGPAQGVQPVFVEVLQADPPQGDALVAQARRLAKAVGMACKRPQEQVHVVFEPPAAGRVAFGGQLRT